MSVQEFDRKTASNKPQGMSEAEWQARVDCAAAHRFVAHFGWTNLIYNHVTMRVPDQPDQFLLKPHALMFEEVTASSLVKLPISGKAPARKTDDHDGRTGDVQTAGFNIHTAVLEARPEINCVVHVHTAPGMAVTILKEGLLPLTQGAMRFYNRIAYHDYEGISNDSDEKARIARDMGPTHKTMLMRNHGLLTCGTSPREALSLMKFLIEACDTQMRVLATGREIIIPSHETAEAAAQQWDKGDPKTGLAVWPAILRMLDREDTSYRT